MYHLLIFLRKDWGILSNVIRAGSASRFKQIFIACFALGLLAGMAAVHRRLPFHLRPGRYRHAADPAATFSLFFLQPGGHALVSNLITAYAVFRAAGKPFAGLIVGAACGAFCTNERGNHPDFGWAFFHDRAVCRRVRHARAPAAAFHILRPFSFFAFCIPLLRTWRPADAGGPSAGCRGCIQHGSGWRWPARRAGGGGGMFRIRGVAAARG